MIGCRWTSLDIGSIDISRDQFGRQILAQMKVVITGASGLLGMNWSCAAAEKGSVLMLLHEREVAVPGARVYKSDLRSVIELTKLLELERPDALIHTVALTNVELCEQEPELAYQVNVDIAQNVALACRESGVKMVHISTDHLFDGGLPFATEEWLPKPVNVYGKTKAQAESRVLDICNDALVVRTNFYGWGTDYRRSFSDFVVSELRRGERINLFDDVFYTPLLMEELIRAVDELLQVDASGIFNLCGDDRVSKYEFGMALAETFGLNSGLIKRAAFADTTNLIKRPKDMSLSNAKFQLTLGRGLGDLSAHLEMLRRLEPYKYSPVSLR